MAGIGAYFLSATTIIYGLMFNDKENTKEKQSERNSECQKRPEKEINTLIRLVGVIAVSRTLDGLMIREKVFNGKMNWILLGKETTAFVIAVGLSMFIGFTLGYKNKNNNLLVAGITYLFLGVMIGLQYFA